MEIKTVNEIAEHFLNHIDSECQFADSFYQLWEDLVTIIQELRNIDLSGIISELERIIKLGHTIDGLQEGQELRLKLLTILC